MIRLDLFLASDSDDIARLLSTSFDDLPRQSTIEETMENMNLNHSQTGAYLFEQLFD